MLLMGSGIGCQIPSRNLIDHSENGQSLLWPKFYSGLAVNFYGIV